MIAQARKRLGLVLKIRGLRGFQSAEALVAKRARKNQKSAQKKGYKDIIARFHGDKDEQRNLRARGYHENNIWKLQALADAPTKHQPQPKKDREKYRGSMYVANEQQGGSDTVKVLEHPDYRAGGDPRQRRICRRKHEMNYHPHANSNAHTCVVCSSWIWYNYSMAFCTTCGEAYCYYCSSKDPRTFAFCKISNEMSYAYDDNVKSIFEE